MYAVMEEREEIRSGHLRNVLAASRGYDRSKTRTSIKEAVRQWKKATRWGRFTIEKPQGPSAGAADVSLAQNAPAERAGRPEDSSSHEFDPSKEAEHQSKQLSQSKV